MTFSKKRLVQFAALAILVGEVSSASAEVLILRSLGPGAARQYPAGRRVANNSSFALRPGDSVVVLVNGSTRTFRGPGTFSAGGPVRPDGYAANAGQVRRQTGAVRGPGETEVRLASDLWQIDVSRGGRACILAGRTPTLWRPSSARFVQLTITPPTGAPQTLAWSAGQDTLSWPATIPLVNGASYQFSWTGAAAPTRVTARMLSTVQPADVDQVAAALLDNQCRAQLDVLIATRDSGTNAGGRGGGGSPAH